MREESDKKREREEREREEKAIRESELPGNPTTDWTPDPKPGEAGSGGGNKDDSEKKD